MDDPHPAFAAWSAGFRARALAAGIAAPVLAEALAEARFLPEVIARDRHQPEFTRTIADYLETAVSPARIARGLEALGQHAALLSEIEARYRVDRAVLVAIWGLESDFGAHRGDIPTIAALATLACDGRRAALFERELIATLRILEGEGLPAGALQGSWAGAMGHTQFMPSSYLKHAVAFRTPGRRDIWGEDPADALASTAAYLAHFGWAPGAPWGREVRLPEGFAMDLAGPARPAAEWRALGVQGVEGALPDLPAALLLPAGARGVALLTFANFGVIARYNAAEAYVIAVGHLADRLLGGGAFHTPWPQDLRGLSTAERRELQERLTAVGHDTGGIDGLIGPRTITALRRFQRAAGLVADGYPGPDVLERLREHASRG